MQGWVTATWRTIGILICSAMLLTSATLGQTGRVSPPRSFSLAAVEAASEQSAGPGQSQTSDSTFDDTEAVDDHGQPAGSTTDSGNPQPDIQESVVSTAPEAPQHSGENALEDADVELSLLPPANPVPQPGSGFMVPEADRLQFSKAAPVRMAPVRIQIPDAWVDARIRTVGVTPEGEMEAPEDFWEVGWYRYGARPGDEGKAVMAGHLDSQDGAAIFYHIGNLQPGDDIRILLGGPDGERFYRVREVAQYHVDDAPLERIFGPSDTAELILITCGGDWLGNDAGGYTDRIVVYADMVVAGEADSSADPSSSDVQS
jgi:hypothetical protein